jgi:hypothetical protein
VHVDRAGMLGVGQADEEIGSEAERLDDVLADERTVIGLGQRLDHDRRRPVSRAAVIDDARARRPLERESADGPTQQVMVRPRLLRDVGIGKAALVRQELDDGQVALAIRLEARQMLGHPVRVAQRAALGKDPHRARGDDLGIRVHEPQRVLARRDTRGIEPRLAEGSEQGELASAGHGDLSAGIASLRQMAGDDLAEPFERLLIEPEGSGGGRVEREGHGVLSSCDGDGPRLRPEV